MSGVAYPFDPTGLSPGNKVTGEVHTLTEVNSSTYRVLIPVFAPFYLDNFTVHHVDSLGVSRPLIKDVDYTFCLPYIGATRSIGKMLYGGVTINTELIDGTILIGYQCLGGEWAADADYVRERLAELIYNPRITVWDIVTNKPNSFPPINHPVDIDTTYGHKELIDAVNALAAAVAAGPSTSSEVVKHFTSTDNPHEVTKAQIGLGNVPNYEQATDAEVLAHSPLNKTVTLRQILLLLGS